MARLNKKILCFIDECGTAGQPNFALGCVMLWARDAGRADKSLSDLLEPNVNELHAAGLQHEYLQSLLARFAQTETPNGMVMLNRLGTSTVGTAPQIYANDVVEAVKIAAKQFRDENNIRDRNIGNVELILDRNEQNTHPDFMSAIATAQKRDGRFRAVTHATQIDSAASRMLQLADVVAYARMWIRRGEENAEGLRQNYKIRIV
ncbi:hypothetical protein FA743_14400 [Paracoccus gahaiensis]|uniref:DUF3800 domain-containing protein n=1 Tax=Paracoccus gahaiensis TaxID=1706839 RepID=A0A4V5MV29_9RHOB|nr:DUF3800 domain-containing protein [Paracoccus gahaiensis]TJZ90588.1 hypothetical protein FA743_14400 [Paracoccus gahaiensis]